MRQIVLGTLFGDEGKGVVTRWLAKKAEDPVIIRFSGGPQSAHTVMTKEITHICSSFGSGILEGIPTMYIGGFFDVCSFVKECEVLEKKGVEIPEIWLSSVKKIYPHDVYLGRFGDRERRDGTCGKGIYQAWKRPDPGYFDIRKLNRYWKWEGLLEEEISDLWKIYEEAKESKYMSHLKNNPTPKKDYIYEGTQGLLLDMDHGFFPNVTPSKTGLKGLEEKDHLLLGDEVYLVIRSYLTRHGKGYTPKNPKDFNNPYETNHYNQFQGEFKTGELEVDLIRRAIDRHSLDVFQKKYDLKINVVITCLDIHTPDIERVKDAFSEYLSVSQFYGSYSPYSDDIRPL